jgi:tyrosyl-tRNA synthetase
MLGREEIENLVALHTEAPHLRELQKRLAKEITCMVHSEADYLAAVEASQILFGKATSDALRKLDEKTFLAVFDGVPACDINRAALPQNIVELLAVATPVFPSKGECRKMIQGGGVSLNKEKIAGVDFAVTPDHLINGKYLLVQKGKKNYFIICVK